jgi:methyl-accepting chemotaxis protein
LPCSSRSMAMAEQSAAASHALAASAGEIERLVEGFQVTAEVRDYRPRAAPTAPAAPRRDEFRQRYIQGANALKIEPSARPGR